MKKTNAIRIGDISIANNGPFVIFAGPCVIESEKMLDTTAGALSEMAAGMNIPLIFKSSYDKANRTSIDSYRGPGLKKGLKLLEKIKNRYNLKLLVDVHRTEDVEPVARVADILQIPAFLCRQTDLVVKCALSNKPVNIKKGQFLSPGEMVNVIRKVESAGNNKVLLTERGTCFGYNNLIVDMRSLVIMKGSGYPVIFDATHSVQLPGKGGSYTQGQREFVLPLMRAALSIGIAGIFAEVHPRPESSLSDSANTIRLKDFGRVLRQLKLMDDAVKTTIL